MINKLHSIILAIRITLIQIICKTVIKLLAGRSILFCAEIGIINRDTIKKQIETLFEKFKEEKEKPEARA